jgi:hypothetical protein
MTEVGATRALADDPDRLVVEPNDADGSTENEWRENSRLLGPGPVTCGHRANKAK